MEIQNSKILIIIPCYNEAERLPVESFNQFLSEPENASVSFLFVNDGSKDNTIEVLNKLCNQYANANALDLKKIAFGVTYLHQLY